MLVCPTSINGLAGHNEKSLSRRSKFATTRDKETQEKWGIPGSHLFVVSKHNGQWPSPRGRHRCQRHRADSALGHCTEGNGGCMAASHNQQRLLLLLPCIRTQHPTRRQEKPMPKKTVKTPTSSLTEILLSIRLQGGCGGYSRRWGYSR